MFAKTVFFVALFALLANLALADTPPACLLAAIKYVVTLSMAVWFLGERIMMLTEFISAQGGNPADLGTLCGSKSPGVQTSIAGLCGANAAAALSSYSASCKSAGHSISMSLQPFVSMDCNTCVWGSTDNSP
jgi:hypothetical protein